MQRKTTFVAPCPSSAGHLTTSSGDPLNSLRFSSNRIQTDTEHNWIRVAVLVEYSCRKTPHFAVLPDQGQVATLPMEKGANVNGKAKDKDGGTPLHWMAAFGRTEIAKLLIEKGGKSGSGFWMER